MLDNEELELKRNNLQHNMSYINKDKNVLEVVYKAEDGGVIPVADAIALVPLNGYQKKDELIKIKMVRVFDFELFNLVLDDSRLKGKKYLKVNLQDFLKWRFNSEDEKVELAENILSNNLEIDMKFIKNIGYMPTRLILNFEELGLEPGIDEVEDLKNFEIEFIK